MSQIPDSQESRSTLLFSSAGRLVNFLLTCLEDSRLGRGTAIYEQGLDRIILPKPGKSAYQINLRGRTPLVELANNMAVANRGVVKPYGEPPLENLRVLSIDEFVHAVRLQEVTMPIRRFPHVLAALWGAEAEDLGTLLGHAWELGASSTEVAFVGQAEDERPSHLVRVSGLKHPDAFHAWCACQTRQIEIYAPVHAEQQEARYYVLWGHRYPLAGLDRLLGSDHELVLLRPQSRGRQQWTQWITYAPGDVNFFRKAYEFVDLKLGDVVAPIVLKEDPSPQRVPMELAFVGRPRTAATRLQEVDQEIDRQRRKLQDLELTRFRLAADKPDGVYFAYRFDQPDEEHLNARLIRLMQQRLGTLAFYDYAFCEPKRGKPYHLVIANRTHRQLGLALQPADRVYYQPAQWRQWGVNLYLPLGCDLAPRIESGDSLHALLAMIEKAPAETDGDDEGDRQLPAASDCVAILWDPGAQGRIVETRIPRVASLLSQYRVLNGFHRLEAGAIRQATRRRLEESISALGETVQREADGLTEDLLTYVDQRTAALEASYGRLENQLHAAEKFVEQVEPKVQRATSVVVDLPNDWVSFVNRVIDMHRELSAPAVDAYQDLRQHVHNGRDVLFSLALRNRDLLESATRRRALLQQRIEACNQTNAEIVRANCELDDLSQRAVGAIREIQAAHALLADRIRAAESLESRAVQLQQEIDQIDTRHKAARQRLAQIKAAFDECRERTVEIQRLTQEAEAAEKSLLERGADLAQRREELKRQISQIACQLARIEQRLASFGNYSTELDRAAGVFRQQLEMVDAHAAVLDIWATQRDAWEQYVRTLLDEETQRMNEVNRAMERLQQTTTLAADARQSVDAILTKLNEIQASVGAASASLDGKGEVRP
jgi:hypothetical protein